MVTDITLLWCCYDRSSSAVSAFWPFQVGQALCMAWKTGCPKGHFDFAMLGLETRDLCRSGSRSSHSLFSDFVPWCSRFRLQGLFGIRARPHQQDTKALNNTCIYIYIHLYTHTHPHASRMRFSTRPCIAFLLIYIRLRRFPVRKQEHELQKHQSLTELKAASTT